MYIFLKAQYNFCKKIKEKWTVNIENTCAIVKKNMVGNTTLKSQL